MAVKKSSLSKEKGLVSGKKSVAKEDGTKGK